MNWTLDDAGDLINLDHIQAIVMNPTVDEEPGMDYEIIAINSKDESYRLLASTEAACRDRMSSLRLRLMPPIIV